MSPLCRGRKIFLGMVTLGMLCVVLSVGCSEVERRQDEQQSIPYLTSDSRHLIPLSPSAGKEHRALMLQHLEIIQVIMSAMVEEDYELARGLTELHLGFFRYRDLISPVQRQARQDASLPEVSQQPDDFPPAYHDLAMAHNAAAEELARIIPTKDLKQILPKFNNVLKACVACHLEFKVREQS
jgi:cytochrome c556